MFGWRHRPACRTFKEVGELVEVSDGELVEVLPCPDREDEDGGAEAGGDADDDGGEALVREADELVHAVARHGHQAEGEDEDGHAVVVPRLHLRDEPREGRRRRCKSASACNTMAGRRTRVSTCFYVVIFVLVKKLRKCTPGAFAYWHSKTCACMHAVYIW